MRVDLTKHYKPIININTHSSISFGKQQAVTHEPYMNKIKYTNRLEIKERDDNLLVSCAVGFEQERERVCVCFLVAKIEN